MSDELIMLLVSGLLSALVAGIIVYFKGKSLEKALEKTLDELMENGEWLDTIEMEFDESVDVEVQTFLLAMLTLAERAADGTLTELDNKLIALLKKFIGENA